MLYSAGVLLLLLAFLISTVLTHSLWNRLVPTDDAPQGRALLVVAGNFLIFVALASWAAIRDGESLAWIPYLAICVGSVGYCYWSLICLSESGRRYRIVFMVDSRQAATIGDLEKLYGREAIVGERLIRLEDWAEIRRQDNRFFCTRGLLYKASLIVYGWARLLGFRWFP